MTGRFSAGVAARFYAVLAVLAAAVPASAGAQSVRITGSTSFRYVELRPMVGDSIPVDEAEGGGILRQTRDGRVVRCVPGDAVCRHLRPGSPVSTVGLIQDLDVSAWGFGEGVRLLAQMRGRTAWGGNPDLWPRGEEAFDLLVAFGEIDRARFRVRAGRQWKVSGLGYYNFDGLAVLARPGAGVSVEGYVGRSLVRGLNEPRTGGALESIEALAPDEPGVLLGIQARYRPNARLGIGALYQVDVRRDRAGLYSELAAVDGVFQFGGVSVEGSMEVDAAAGALNEAGFLLRSAPVGRVAFNAGARRYRPYFELWTIWGAFSPVGFDEGRAGLTWAVPGGRIVVRSDAAYRRYSDAGVDEGVGGFRDDGWGLGADASWTPDGRWWVGGGYRLDVGFGAGRSDGYAGVVRRVGDAGSIALRGSAFQRAYEFRLDEGTVVGLGVDSSLPIRGRARLVAGFMAYRLLDAGPAPDLDWNQVRGNLRLQWTVGSEPGVSRGTGGGG